MENLKDISDAVCILCQRLKWFKTAGVNTPSCAGSGRSLDDSLWVHLQCFMPRAEKTRHPHLAAFPGASRRLPKGAGFSGGNLGMSDLGGEKKTATMKS